MRFANLIFTRVIHFNIKLITCLDSLMFELFKVVKLTAFDPLKRKNFFSIQVSKNSSNMSNNKARVGMLKSVSGC